MDRHVPVPGVLRDPVAQRRETRVIHTAVARRRTRTAAVEHDTRGGTCVGVPAIDLDLRARVAATIEVPRSQPSAAREHRGGRSVGVIEQLRAGQPAVADRAIAITGAQLLPPDAEVVHRPRVLTAADPDRRHQVDDHQRSGERRPVGRHPRRHHAQPALRRRQEIHKADRGHREGPVRRQRHPSLDQHTLPAIAVEAAQIDRVRPRRRRIRRPHNRDRVRRIHAERHIRRARCRHRHTAVRDHSSRRRRDRQRPQSTQHEHATLNRRHEHQRDTVRRDDHRQRPRPRLRLSTELHRRADLQHASTRTKLLTSDADTP